MDASHSCRKNLCMQYIRPDVGNKPSNRTSSSATTCANQPPITRSVSILRPPLSVISQSQTHRPPEPTSDWVLREVLIASRWM
ncbi:uncharacterized protein LAESUDRAFT_719378 [Laetiporus sulphureus 93-53]|uniref:Uncharacterized protein n=1 Tax=Laetiporus sulphureus 93-53 TaxID=1314785 RepID=A0A165IH25_9APHY|nr:uncharacterized protein LAESUDRAFT_719378 [Laetiporus sulphureus 93-53]KZT13061.1 hypothetical protein LAESUDRAFT_719378 [Laetiporus sulphureus 93-53]